MPKLDCKRCVLFHCPFIVNVVSVPDFIQLYDDAWLSKCKCVLFPLCDHRRPKLSLWGVIIIFFYLYANVPWHSYRRRLLLHNDRVSLRESWLWPLAFEGVMLQRFEFTKVCMGKNSNIKLSRNFDIFAIKMTYLNALLSFLLSSWGNTKSDNSLKRLRIALKSKMTIERTTRHWGMSFLLQNYQNFGANIYVNIFSHTNLCKFKPL